MPLQLLIVGQTDRAEASPVREWTAQVKPVADLRQSESLEAALNDLVTGDWIPDLVVIVQSWPDEYSSLEVGRLSQSAPLARWVVCYGSWCESDGRTRDVWPLSVRIPLRSATSRLDGEWQLLNGEPIPSIPLSASREERFAIDHPPRTRSASAGVILASRRSNPDVIPFSQNTSELSPKSVQIHSPDPEYHRYLTELILTSDNPVIVDIDPKTRPDAVIFDLDPWNDQRRSNLNDLLNKNPDAVIIGLMSLPSPETTAELLKLGVNTVLPKLGDQQRIRHAITATQRN